MFDEEVGYLDHYQDKNVVWDSNGVTIKNAIYVESIKDLIN